MEVSGLLHDHTAFPYPPETAPSTDWIGGWVGPRAGLNAVAKGKNPIIAPAENQIPVIQPAAYSLY